MINLKETLPKFWRALPGIYYLNQPAAPQEIERVERSLGRRMPDGLRWLWSICDGIGADEDNTTVYSASRTLECTNMFQRQSGYPNEAIVVGDNGAGLHFVLWVPAGSTAPPEVVLEVIEFCWSPLDIKTAAKDILRFLWARHSFYALPPARVGGPCFFGEEVKPSMLDLIGAPDPKSLGIERFTDPYMDALYGIASEGLPLRRQEGWSNEALRAHFGASGSLG